MNKVITLSEFDRQQLEEIAGGEKQGPVQRRAQVLLQYDQGKSSNEVSREVGLSLTQVRFWRREFLEKGWDIFPGRLRPSLAEKAPLIEPEPEVQPARTSQAARPEPEEPAPEDIRAQTTEPSVPVDDEEALPTLDPDVPVTPQQLREYYPHDLSRSDLVHSLAAQLFNGTKSLHRLGANHRRLLLSAAQLFDLLSDEQDRPDHKATQKLILSWKLKGFSQQDQHAVALIVRHQRGRIKQKHDTGEAIPPYFYREILILTAILRIAVGLSSVSEPDIRIEKIIPETGSLLIRISGSDAQRAARRGEEAASLWSKIFFQNVRIAPSRTGKKGTGAEELPLPGPFKAPGIEPWDPLSEAGRKVLLYNFAEMLDHEAGTRDGSDIEHLHDMRVATRRMRVAFEIFETAFVQREIKPYIKGLRTAGKTLGRVRDRDVFLEKAEKYLEQHPEEKEGLNPLKRFWEQEREQYRQRMINYLNSQAYRGFVEDFNIFLQTPGAGAVRDQKDTPSMQVRFAAPSMLYECLGRVRAYQRFLHSASIEQLHELRIDFKRLRYTMEYFREVLGKEAKWIISEIKKVQDHLGDLNDADVACNILNDFLEDFEERQMQLPLSERLNPEPIVAYLAVKHAERHQLMLTFEETWAAFDRPEFMQNLAMAISVL